MFLKSCIVKEVCTIFFSIVLVTWSRNIFDLWKYVPTSKNIFDYLKPLKEKNLWWCRSITAVYIRYIPKLSRARFAKKDKLFFTPIVGTFVLGTMIVISLQMLYVVECGTVFTFTGKCLVIESIQLICSCLIFGLSEGAPKKGATALMVLSSLFVYRMEFLPRKGDLNWAGIMLLIIL